MIVAFGDAVVDLFAQPRGADITAAESFVPYLGGAPANVALVARRLGVPTRFVGAVGRDAHGDRLVAVLTAEGVDVRAVVRVPERTSVTFVHVGHDGARAFLSYRVGGADFALTPAHLAALAEPPLAGATWLHVTTSPFAAAPAAAAAHALLDDAALRGVPVSLDLNVRGHLWPDRGRLLAEASALAARAAVVKASEEDLAHLGIAPTLDALDALAPSARVVLTLAERGAVARVAGVDLRVSAPAVCAVDATGAGDAFVAALLATLHAAAARPGCPGFDDPAVWRAALGLGCAVGARAVTAVGATEALRDLGAERARLAVGRGVV